MRKGLLSALVAAILATCGSAAAKGPVTLQLCGANGCAAVGGELAWPAGPSAAVAPAAPTPYYVLTYDGPANPFAYWIPGAQLVRQVDQGGIAQWLRVSADTAAKLDELASTLRPNPVPLAFDVVVNHHSVAHGASYVRLFAVGTPVSVWPRSVVWIPVRVFSTPASPWGDGANSVWISKRGGYLMRDRQVVRISPLLARRVLARRPLDSSR